MHTPHRLRNLALVFVLTHVTGVSLARGDELDASGAARGIVIHDAASTLRDYCTTDGDGTLWFTLPGGRSFELVTSTADPSIVNPGDGSFHPFEAAEVRAALADLRFPVAGIAADVFLLPYPRRAQVESAAGPQLILLSPGVRALSRGHQHAEFVHELGHVVQHALLPDGDARWGDYRHMRDIDDPRFAPTAPHADRPHEIFAEDFRALFGGTSATYSGTIENSALAPPDDIPGLRSFLLLLAGAEVPLAFSATPNPTRGALRFTLAGAEPMPLDLFDAAGRRIATLAPRSVWNGIEWSFDGTDDQGRTVVPGVLFARSRGSRGAGIRVVVTP